MRPCTSVGDLSVGPSVVRFMMLKNAYFCMKLTNFTMGRITMNSTRRVLGQLLVRSFARTSHSLLCTACLARVLRCAHGKEVYVFEIMHNGSFSCNCAFISKTNMLEASEQSNERRRARKQSEQCRASK